MKSPLLTLTLIIVSCGVAETEDPKAPEREIWFPRELYVPPRTGSCPGKGIRFGSALSRACQGCEGFKIDFLGAEEGPCPATQGPYEREQSTAYEILQRVHLKARSLFRHEMPHLWMFPVIEQKDGGYYVDATAYLSDLQAVAVWPLRDPAANRLWYSEFVMAHELGHHIEREIVGSPLGKGTILRQAISESFADLVGMHFGSSNFAHVCKSRSPTIGEFIPGTTKSTENLLGTVCRNAADPHDVGSILSYVLHHEISSKEQLANWAYMFFSSPSEENWFATILKFSDNRPRLCRSFESRLPLFASYWVSYCKDL